MEDNTKVETQGTVETKQEIDYKAELDKTLLELDRVREAMKKSNSENAEYKRKERENMSAEQQKAQDLKDLVESKKALEEKVAQYEREKLFVAQGFTAEEINDLTANEFSAESIKKLVDKRVADALENDKLKRVKETTQKQGMTSGSDDNKETLAQSLAKSKKNSNSQAIKDKFR